jgi:uncharacterized protein
MTTLETGPRSSSLTVDGPRRTRHGRGRWWRRVAVAIVLVLVAGYAGAGWYLSGRIIDELRISGPSSVEYDTEIVLVEGGRITLERSEAIEKLEVDRDAIMGLTWEGGYGQVGPALSFAGPTEVRELTVLDGTPPPTGVAVADVDPFAYSTDPARVGFAYETVTYPSPLGELEAWLFPGERETWIVGVHGRNADRHEFLRLVDVTADLGYPTLLVRYRNDPGAPSSDGSLILLGQEEWQDVAAAVDFALDNGATGVVLVGASLGSGLVLAHLLEGDPAPVQGAILESPNADFRETIRLRSGDALPIGGPVGDSLLGIGRAVTSLRTGLAFDRVDYVDRAGELTTPMLVFHGTADTTIPFEIGESLAAARPDLVEFHPVEGGGHVRAWNEDPQAYATHVRGFLERIAGDEP